MDARNLGICRTPAVLDSDNKSPKVAPFLATDRLANPFQSTFGTIILSGETPSQRTHRRQATWHTGAGLCNTNAVTTFRAVTPLPFLLAHRANDLARRAKLRARSKKRKMPRDDAQDGSAQPRDQATRVTSITPTASMLDSRTVVMYSYAPARPNSKSLAGQGAESSSGEGYDVTHSSRNCW